MEVYYREAKTVPKSWTAAMKTCKMNTNEKKWLEWSVCSPKCYEYDTHQTQSFGKQPWRHVKWIKREFSDHKNTKMTKQWPKTVTKQYWATIKRSKVIRKRSQWSRETVKERHKQSKYETKRWEATMESTWTERVQRWLTCDTNDIKQL